MTGIKDNKQKEEKYVDKYWELKKSLPNKENEKVVNEFLLHLKLANRSKLTIIDYRRYLERFFGDKEEAYSLLSSDQILAWLRTNESHLKESSYRRYLSILSSFYHFCVQESLLTRSPIKKRWFPRLPKPVPKYLEKEDIAKVRQESEKISLRDQALVEFMLTTGCRVAEVFQLNQEDVDLKNRTVRVIGKGKKIRHVHFTDKCAVLLERYFETREQMQNSPLFLSRRGTRLTIRGIQRVLSTIGENINLNSSLHPHRLRHTFATVLLAKGAELSFISDELGHADLSTTQIYARLPKKEIIAQYRKFMG